MKKPLADRIAALIIVIDSGCWIWIGCGNSDGYQRMGGLGDNNHRAYAHRVSYELFVDRIPEGLTLDHTCRVRACVNWRHLEPVTLQVNIARAVKFRREAA